MGFIERIASGEFVILTEIDPPKGADASALLTVAGLLKGRVDALSVTDCPGGVMRMGSLAASCLLKDKGLETVFNISGRDRNSLALQSDILSAWALGIKNIFISDGVSIKSGDHPNAMPVNEVDPVMLLSIIKKLGEGFDFGGNEINGKPDFKCGISVNCSVKTHALDLEIKKLEEKIMLGADFAASTAVFDLKSFEEFINKVRKSCTIPVIAEIILLKSPATAKFINKHVNNALVPESIIDRLLSAGDKGSESIAIAVDLIKGLKGMCQGVKIVPLGWEDKIPAIVGGLE